MNTATTGWYKARCSALFWLPTEFVRHYLFTTVNYHMKSVVVYMKVHKNNTHTYLYIDDLVNSIA